MNITSPLTNSTNLTFLSDEVSNNYWITNITDLSLVDGGYRVHLVAINEVHALLSSIGHKDRLITSVVTIIIIIIIGEITNLRCVQSH
jgi:hypothetical protein